MRPSAIFLTLSPAVGALSKPDCHFRPSTNATAENYPGARCDGNNHPPYYLNLLSEVPVADICTSGSSADELACARRYIDAIDEQLAFLYARRLGYAAVAGHSKYREGDDLNDPGRNGQVAEGMAQRVLRYGGSLEAGRVMGGEGCQIFASLQYEIANIQEACDPSFDEEITRPCN